MNLCISLNVHFINDKSLPQELLFARQLRIKGSQYFMLLCSLSNIRKFHLLMYLLEQVMEHDQWLVTTSSVLLTWKNSVKYLYQSLSIIASVWLQKNLSAHLNKSLYTVTTTVNKIKTYAVNNWLFSVDNDDFEWMLLHTEVYYLSKSKCVRCFYNLFDTIVEFFWIHECFAQ